MEKCYVCDCVLPEHSTFISFVQVKADMFSYPHIRKKHSELYHCGIALAAAQGACIAIVDKMALKLGEQRIKEFAKDHHLEALIKAWSL
jgi:hypothetical protein